MKTGLLLKRGTLAGLIIRTKDKRNGLINTNLTAGDTGGRRLKTRHRGMTLGSGLEVSMEAQQGEKPSVHSSRRYRGLEIRVLGSVLGPFPQVHDSDEAPSPP